MIADRQTHTDRQTDTLITILRSAIGDGVTGNFAIARRSRVDVRSTPVSIYISFG